ncbi:MAG: DEAD/DEAH box helicase family protein, partial [Methermicoccaceae archaeon]
MSIDDWFAYDNYRPYQQEMLERVKHCVRKGEHSVLMIDAPTGSGKTSTLSAALAERGDKKIVVALRTVSQIGGYLDEVRRIWEKKNKHPKVAYLVGKKKMCKLNLRKTYIACDVLKILSREMIEARMREMKLSEGVRYDPMSDTLMMFQMREARSTNQQNEGGDEEQFQFCPYYIASKSGMIVGGRARFTSSPAVFRDAEKVLGTVPMPTELKEMCVDTCPYEVMARASKAADVILLNYHHVLDEKMREKMFSWLGLDPSNTVLIVDEAHNVGDAIRSINTVHITSEDVRRARGEVTWLSREVKRSFEAEKGMLSRLELFINSGHIKRGGNAERDNVRGDNKNETLIEREVLIRTLKAESLFEEDISPHLMDLVELAKKKKEAMRRYPESHLEPLARLLSIVEGERECIVAKGKNRLWAGEIDPSPYIKQLVDSMSSTIMLSGTSSPLDAYELLYFGVGGRAEKLTLPNAFPSENRLILVAKEATTLSSRR